MKKLYWVYLVLSLSIIGLAVFGFIYYINQQPLIPNNAADSYTTYAKYLKRTNGNSEEVMVYFSPNSGSEYNWYVTIYNQTDDFYCGTLKLYDEDQNKLYEDSYVNIKPHEVRMLMVQLDGKPVNYTWTKTRFYQFNYDKPEADAALSMDSDSDFQYVWNNLVFKSEDLTVENCLEYGKYLYIEDILAGQSSPDTYCYDEELTTYHEVNGVSYPDVSTAKFGIIIDQEDQTIKIVDLVANNEVLEEISMK